jgi:hypothetical protein
LREIGRARQVLQRFSAAHPGNTAPAQSMAFVHRRKGSAMLRLGRPQEAERYQRRAAQAFTRPVEADSPDQQFRSDLVCTYRHLRVTLDALDDVPARVAAARADVVHAGK